MAHHINKQNLKFYEFFKRRGDADKLAKICGVVRGTIYIALSTGRCSEDVAEKIHKFYINRYGELSKIYENATKNS